MVDEAHVLQIFVMHVPISKAKRALKRDTGFQLVSQGIFSLCETPLVVRCRQSSAFQQDDACRRCKEMICYYCKSCSCYQSDNAQSKNQILSGLVLAFNDAFPDIMSGNP